MMRTILIYSVLIFFIPLIADGSTLQDLLYKDIEDGTLNHFSHIEAAIIISGVSSRDSLDDNRAWFREIISDIEQKRIVDDFEKTASAEKIFLYLHTTWLKTYIKEATTLLDIKKKREYNCVSATILYNLVCDEVGLSTMAFETPTHVYTIFTNFGQNIMVENTTSMGFNIIKNLDRYSRYMAQYYPTDEIYRIGLHRLYAYENSKGRQISNVELLGLISYNQAYFAVQEKRYQEAYDYVLLAQQFNQDSRSNQRFEINLYYNWGKQLFEQHDFYKAFGIFADGYYRYSDNVDFRNNCVVSFFNALNAQWIKKEWDLTMNIVFEITDLDILSDADLVSLANTIKRWINYYYVNKDKGKGIEALKLFKGISTDQDQVAQMEGMINSL